MSRRAKTDYIDLEREDVRLPDGTRLTDDVTDAIVSDVRRKAGRHSRAHRRSRPACPFG